MPTQGIYLVANSDFLLNGIEYPKGSTVVDQVEIAAVLASPYAGNCTQVPVVASASLAGSDYSANAATVPMNGYVLLATIPATLSRAYVEVQNQSGVTLQLVRDDGLGNNQTSILIAAGAGAGQQGGGWSSATFKGRVRVYGAAGSQVAAYQE